MVEPNLNTFAPKSNVNSRYKKKLPSFGKGTHVIVIGAGAAGGWSALYLLRKGFKVTLVDGGAVIPDQVQAMKHA